MKRKKKISFILLILTILVGLISINVKAVDNDNTTNNTKQSSSSNSYNNGGGSNNSTSTEPPDPILDKNKYQSNLCKETIKKIADAYGIGVKYVSNSGTTRSPQLIIYMGYENKDGELVIDTSKNTNATFRISEIVVADIPSETNGKLITYADFKNNKSLLKNYTEYTNYKSYLYCKYYYCGSSYGKRSLYQKFGLYDTSLAYRGQIKINATETKPTRYYIVLESITKDAILRQKCGAEIYSNPVIMIDIPGGKAKTYDEFKMPTPVTVQTNGMIDCNITHPNNSFEKSFCDVWNLKDKGVKVREFSKTSPNYASYIANGGEKVSAFTCDPFIFDTNSTEYKYTNTGYLLGKMDMTIEVGKYVYKLGGQYLDKPGQATKKSFLSDKYKVLDDPSKDRYNSDETAIYNELKAVNVVTETISCKITCRETVAIEYGSPVASKAGLCFEYNVKVTSRVNCQSESPNLPTKHKRCEAVPVCNHCGQNDRYPAAGPNEEFDSCINSCDGGKYSLSCSKSCYNKVYGRSGLTNSFSLMDNILATKMESGRRPDSGWPTPTLDDYYYIQNGNILWYDSSKTLGRWYFNNNSFLGHGCSYGGAAALCGCCATCWWEGCNTNQYLNPGEAERDSRYNTSQYYAAVDVCSKYSKCSTTQATFTISANYIHGNDSTKSTIQFPYSTSNKNLKDTIQYDEGTVKCTMGESYPNSTLRRPVVQNNENHCYNCGSQNIDNNATSSRMYVAEWGFPGSWVNGKSRAISYEPRAGWYKIKNKFCIPSNSNDINEKWWNYYQCTDSKSCNKTPTKTELDITYNIDANSKNFGMFGWDIDIKCFYALNKNSNTILTPTQNSINSTANDTPKYTVRSVELTNLFPSQSGDEVPSSDTSIVGRDAGFNWTSSATNNKSKDFTSDPLEYRTWVQKIGNGIYTEEYVDYDIYLTKSDIRELRKRKNNLSGFNSYEDLGQNIDDVSEFPYESGHSLLFYQSDLLRGSKPLLINNPQRSDGINKIPDSSLYCNNIKDKNSCFIVGGNE